MRPLRLDRTLVPLLEAAIIGFASLVLVGAAQDSAGEFNLESYWRQPLAAQAEPPSAWTELERSLAPQDCGQCHAAQFAQWQTSRHAHAFSAGLLGQILAYDNAAAAECLQCHAPLSEQRVAFEDAKQAGNAAIAERDGLAAAGNSCGGCHVRDYRHFAPPQRGTGATGPSRLPAPHGGVMRTRLFEQAEFCSVCHQFPATTAVNGKPLENTFAEWQASPQAAQGVTCQSCHMPNRRHLWRGIHDPQMVVSGLTPNARASAKGVRFQITSTGIGHAFPTYVTPKAVIYAVALDQAGVPRQDTLRSYEISRKVRSENDHWVELSDTRLLPGQTAAVEIEWGDSSHIRTWLEIFPDDFYEREIFPGLVTSLAPGSDAQQLILKASADAAASHFRVFETELQKP